MRRDAQQVDQRDKEEKFPPAKKNVEQQFDIEDIALLAVHQGHSHGLDAVYRDRFVYSLIFAVHIGLPRVYQEQRLFVLLVFHQFGHKSHHLLVSE